MDITPLHSHWGLINCFNKVILLRFYDELKFLILSRDGKCSGYHLVSKSQFHQKVDIAPLCCQPSTCCMLERSVTWWCFCVTVCCVIRLKSCVGDRTISRSTVDWWVTLCQVSHSDWQWFSQSVLSLNSSTVSSGLSSSHHIQAHIGLQHSVLFIAVFAKARGSVAYIFYFLSASLYFSKRGAYWDRLCRDAVGRCLLVVGWLSRTCSVAKRCILGL